jgi:hypothetical protein
LLCNSYSSFEKKAKLNRRKEAKAKLNRRKAKFKILGVIGVSGKVILFLPFCSILLLKVWQK